MGIQINEPKTSREGVECASHYLRLEITLLPAGDKLKVEAYHYASKCAFDAGYNTICTNTVETFNYDAVADGDALTAAHNKLVAALTTGDEPTHAAENVSIVDMT